MEVLDLKMVCDYILSKRISKKKISYLEDDVEYMMLTMIKSNDPRMYRFCSDKVKLDYNFVKFYVNRFRDNYAYADTAARYYLEHSNNPFNDLELNIIMMDIAYENDVNDFHYGLSALSRYFIIDSYHTSVANRINIENEVMKQVYGIGFADVLEKFSSSEIIINYLAKQKISELVLRHYKELEVDFHKCFDNQDYFKDTCGSHLYLKESIQEQLYNPFCNRDEIDGYKPYKIMIDFISKYDETLAQFTQSRLDLLDSLDNILRKLYKNWQWYDSQLENVQYNAIIELYEENHDRFEYQQMFGKYDVLQFAGRQLGIDNIFNEYIDPEQYMFVGYFDSNVNKTFDDYMNECIYESEQNLETYNRLVDAIKAILDSRCPSDVERVQMDECKVTRLRSFVS